MRRLPFLVVAAMTFGACAGSASPSGSGSAPSVSLPTATSVPATTPATAPASATAAAATPFGPLARTFASPIYGYTIKLAEGWTVHAATMLADDPKSTEVTGTDVVTVTGTDTTIQTVASDLGGEAFAAWLKDYRADVAANVPPGCDGGDPTTWPAVTVGDHQGVWEEKCNAAVAIVEDGGKAYQFAWENATFSLVQHLPETDFKAVLATVTFPRPTTSAPATP